MNHFILKQLSVQRLRKSSIFASTIDQIEDVLLDPHAVAPEMEFENENNNEFSENAASIGMKWGGDMIPISCEFS